MILLYPFFVDVSKEWNPLWMHIVLAGYVLGYVLLSYWIRFIQENFLLFTYAFAFLGCFWMTALTFNNELRIDYMASTVLALLMGGVIFRHTWWLWGFFFSQFAFSLALAPIPENPTIPVYVYLLITGIEVMGVGLVMRNLISERYQMHANEKERERRQKELLQVEKELIVEVASASRLEAGDIPQTIESIAQKTIDVLGASEITVWLIHKKGSFVECSLENARGNEKGILGMRVPGQKISRFLEVLDAACRP